MKLFLTLQETKQARKQANKERKLLRGERRQAKYMAIDLFDEIDLKKYMDIEPYLMYM